MLVLGAIAVCITLLILFAAISLAPWFADRKANGAGERSPAVSRRVEPPPMAPADLRLASRLPRGDVGSFFSAADYPVDALRRGEQGRTVARLAVGPDGVVGRCVVMTSSGSAALDAATCRVALTKVRYQPARDEAGRPIAATVRLPVRWVLPKEAPGAPHDFAPTSTDAGSRGWLSMLLLAVAGFEGWTAWRGLKTGKVAAPRVGHVAVRATSPVIFHVYLAVHAVAAVALGGSAIVTMVVLG